ncbi:hypothetical protein ACRB8A_12445 [Arthrobacter sp. G.S.26]|uniref:hypothetical protein n=1 Tax=Arthrobacter sp. G.S.26 TaxID=3433706 RepID=UPI003D786DBC
MSECSAKGTRTEVHNAVEMRDLSDYFRREHGMSRRRSGFMAREVYRDEALSLAWLPAGWHESIYPPAIAFMRPLGKLGEPLSPAQHAAWLKAGGERAK